MPPTQTREFLRLRVTLIDSEPEIWRTFDIDASLTLRDLHDALQVIVGWRQSHLHQFMDADPYERMGDLPRIGRQPRRWTMPGPFEDELDDAEPEEATTIAEAFEHDGPLYYEYDFGDSWMHRLDLIERGTMEPHEPPVTLVRGEQRAPYEDAGGLPGYAEKLEILDDPRHPDHDFITEWVRDTVGPWKPTDPEFFDPDGVQTELNLRFAPERSGLDPRDMAGLVAERPAEGGLTLESPLVDLVFRLPVPGRIELRAHLHRTGALSDDLPDDATRERMTAPFRWLIEAVGVDGLTLTKAGWMPPAVVLDGMTELGWRERWIGEANREDITAPMRNLREAAQRMGIVRLYKGKLLLGADAKKALRDPGLVWRLVASRLLRGLSDAETDASTLRLLAIADGTQQVDGGANVFAADSAIAFGLDCVGWATSTGARLEVFSIGDLTARVDIVLDIVGVYGSGRWGERPVTLEGRAFAREALR